MTEFPDDELDKLFRKSSEEFDPQFEPEDWNDLKKRLDQHDGRTPGAWLRKWWPLGLLCLCLIVGTIWFALPGSEAEVKRASSGITKSDIPVKKEASTATEREKPVYTAGNEPGTGNAKTPEIETSGARRVAGFQNDTRVLPAESSLAQRKITARSERVTTLPRSQSKAGGVYLESNQSKRKGGDGAISFEREEQKDERKNGARNKGGKPGRNNGVTLTGNDDLVLGGKVEKAMQDSGGVPEKMEVLASMLDTRPLVWKNQGIKPDVTMPETQPGEVPKVVALSPASAPWAVRIGYAPDLSTIGLKNFTRPGTAVSLLAEYSIIPRAYIQIGAIWSRKKYFGYGNEYNIPHYYGPDIQRVDGSCDVLEIPVNLRIDAFVTERSIIFAGAGFSSYRMLKEKYEYSFENEYDPRIRARGWKGNTGWTLLNHLNASVGYERKINQKLSILAEPYIRIPLKGVGYGKVNLITTGMWLSLRYTPAFR